MRAAQITEQGKDFNIMERGIPEPGEGQVRVEACGICHGDTITKFGWWPRPIEYPRVPGHEVVGCIDKVGVGVGAWKEGGRVCIGWQGGFCFECDPCRSGDFTNCVRPDITGITYDGGFAEYLITFEEGLARAPEELAGEEAGPLVCAGLTTFNSLRNSGARPGEVVAVQGVGGLGHLALQYSKKLGFYTVTVSRGKDSEKLAIELGADRYIDSSAADPVEELRAMGGAKAILATTPSGKAISAILDGLAVNGKLILIAQTVEPIEVNTIQLIVGRKSILGWYSGHAKDSEETLEFSIRTGVRVMAESYPLERVNEAFEKMMNGKPRFRVVLHMNK
jgi:propanol-preferring alcohol dehydrogenase